MDYSRAVRERLLGIDDGVQRVEVGIDKIERVARDVGAGGNRYRDRFTDEADFALG